VPGYFIHAEIIMESIGAVILLVLGWLVIRGVLSATGRTVGAAAMAAMGKGSFSDNMSFAFHGIGKSPSRDTEEKF